MASGDKWSRVPKTPKKHGRIRGRVSPEELATLYDEEGLSLEDIAQKFGVTRQAVFFLLKELGIPARGRSKARVLALSKGKFKDRSTARLRESLFSQWSQPMAYLLGYIFTDGSLTRAAQGSFRVQVASIDRDHLEKLAAILGEDVKVKSGKQSKKGFSGDSDRYIHSIGFTRPEMIQDLRRLGLTERKSLTMQFPDVPDEFLRDFVRGCWDGDGSIYLEGGAKLIATFVTGSLSFVRTLRSRLSNRGFGRLTIHTRQPDGVKTKNPSYSMKILGTHAVKFCEFLYDDVPSSLFLIRKCLVYEHWRQQAHSVKAGPGPKLGRQMDQSAFVWDLPLGKAAKAGPASYPIPKGRLSRRGSSSPIGAPAPGRLCAATTSTGLECALRTMHGSLFCRKHQLHAFKPTPSISED